MLLDCIKNQIDSVSVVSFDIFDTLLLRPLIRPSDVFLILEKEYNTINFAKKRCRAEKLAWKKALKEKKEDITIDSIYSYLPYKFQHLKGKEIELESKLLIPNPELIDVYNYALKKKKKIIITSDMYLPNKSLLKILEKNKIKSYYKFFLSNKLNKRKETGTLYKFIIKDLQVSPEEILHIGDNKKSDFEIPQEIGIKSVLYQNIISNSLKLNSIFSSFYDKNKDIDSSFFLASMIIGFYFNSYKKGKPTYWEEFGFKYGGPVVLSYASFIKEEVEKAGIKELLFVARDGYILNKVYKILNQNTITHYIYAPRFTKLIGHFNYNNIDLLSKDMQKILINCLKELGIIINNNKSYLEEIKTNIDILKQYSRDVIIGYKKYIDSLNIKADKLAIIDGISISFSAQFLVTSALSNRDITGFYWAALVKAKESFNGKKFKRYNKENRKLEFANLVEFLLSSSEHPIKNVSDNGVVYKDDIGETEKYKICVSSEMEKSIIEYAEFIHNISQNSGLRYSKDTVYKWINNLINNPQGVDIEMVKKVNNGVDILHNIYEPIIPYWSKGITKKIKIFGINLMKIRKSIFETEYILLDKSVFTKKSKNIIN